MRDSFQLYEKLCNFWGIAKGWCWGDSPISPMGTRRIRWMPKLHRCCRRLTYQEFCDLYGLEMGAE